LRRASEQGGSPRLTYAHHHHLYDAICADDYQFLLAYTERRNFEQYPRLCKCTIHSPWKLFLIQLSLSPSLSLSFSVPTRFIVHVLSTDPCGRPVRHTCKETQHLDSWQSAVLRISVAPITPPPAGFAITSFAHTVAKVAVLHLRVSQVTRWGSQQTELASFLNNGMTSSHTRS
jgi:hypothetical protein